VTLSVARPRGLVRVEVRAEVALKGNKLGGYAAVYDQTTDLGWLGKERMAKRSLDDAMKTSDTRSLFNHDPSALLGRLSAGTLRLSSDDHGLEYEVDLPDTTYARDLRVLVDRGDIDGASFAFVPYLASYDPETDTTTHTQARSLVDVSPVTFPAYQGASTEARSQPLRGSRLRSQLIRARARVHLEG
jgi:HK97 family phage prohead protease